MKTILFSLFLFLPVMSLQNEPKTLVWEDLMDVEWTYDGEFYQVKFGESAKEYDGVEIVVEGFMFPLEYTRTHTTFLVSASPMTNCFFCGPGEAESMMLVESKDAIEYVYKPITMTGTFRLIHDAADGVIYELEGATMVE